MSGIILKKTAAGDIPTPATDKATLFLDDSTGEPTLKDDTGATASLAGPQGDPGEGVPTGGTAGQFLRKSSGTDFDTAFAAIAQSEVTNLTTDLAAKADLAGDTFTGAVEVPDDPYDATGWNGNTEVPTKNAVRDKIESLVVGGGSGAESLITETVVGGGGAANADFTSIATTWRDLRVVIRGRGDKSATFTEIRVRFNGDTGNNYDWVRQVGNGNNANIGEANVAQAQISAGWISASTGPADTPGHVEIRVYDYRNTTFHKSLKYLANLKLGTATGDLYDGAGGGWWRSTAAINQVTVYPDSGNFIAGTVISLYGIL